MIQRRPFLFLKKCLQTKKSVRRRHGQRIDINVVVNVSLEIAIILGGSCQKLLQIREHFQLSELEILFNPDLPGSAIGIIDVLLISGFGSTLKCNVF